AGVGDLLLQLDDHERAARPGVGRDLVDRRVAGDRLLDPPGHQLLDLLRARPRPRAEGGGHPQRDVGVLALGHREVAVDPPDQHHPRDVPRLGEEAGGVVGGADDVFVPAAVGHGYSPSLPGMTRTRSPSTSRLAPLTITRSPTLRPPSTATRLPAIRPSVTSR